LPLIEANYIARTGRKVLVLEKNSRLGGAWGSLDNDEFPYLEIGCHYWDISRRGYEFLRSRLGLDLVPFDPQPKFIYRKLAIPYDCKQAVRIFRDLKLAFERRSLSSFFSNMLLCEYYRPRFFPFTKQFLFPRGGSHELITKLATLAQVPNITILKNRCVDRIDFDFGRQRVRVGADGESFVGNEIVAGTLAQLTDAMRIRPGPGDMLRRVYVHVNLVVRDRVAPTFSYIRFLHHPAIIHMTDFTSSLRHWNANLSGRRIICIGIRDTFDKNVGDQEKIAQLVELLKEHDLVDPSATCELYYWSRYATELLSYEVQKKLERDFAPMFRQLPTTNFSNGIVSNLDRWETVFPPR
jgi:phytoene dehydrogenase-like protein